MSRYWLIATRLLVLIALVVSAVLYSYYLNPLDSQVCAAESGCEVLRRTPLAYFGSAYVSLPLFGMLAFASAFGVSVWCQRRSDARPYLPLLQLLAVGGALGIAFIGYQALYAHAYCWLCLIADSSALLAAVSAFFLDRATAPSSEPIREKQSQGLLGWAWWALAGIAAAAPLVWHTVRPLPPVPEVIRALYRPGTINVVEFADLQCPHCRRLHPLLKSVMASYPERVNFVRKHAPLPQHPFAEEAARGAICADVISQQGEALIDLLVENDLESESAHQAAVQLGIDREAFEACLKAPATQERIEADLTLLRQAGFEGLPTTYVGAQRFVGAQSEATLRDAFERAAAGEGNSGVPFPLFLVGLCLVVAGVTLKGRPQAE